MFIQGAESFAIPEQIDEREKEGNRGNAEAPLRGTKERLVKEGISKSQRGREKLSIQKRSQRKGGTNSGRGILLGQGRRKVGTVREDGRERPGVRGL